jgi:transcriptional regulator with XRE-family HTH domain
MITNERQYRITKAQVARFEEALADAESKLHERGGILEQAQVDQYRSMLAELREEKAQYEALRGSGHLTVENASLAQVPSLLTQARIVSGLTQAELADKLGVAEQQVQRDEKTGYAQASFERILKTAAVLGLRYNGTITISRDGSGVEPTNEAGKVDEPSRDIASDQMVSPS